ncbi:UTRA domain-containing protein [Agrobacterium vitis]|uniref:GntR family transcriptional regulator n=1 Tax=Rhizobium/Agrobacterium group TaxID=227290 RepID=UPI0012E92975|nr:MULTISPECIES: GntR family transcriptional regulator [Rhizobium/Agrobacterium group]MVA45877.1 UTRA domain-containing protein [Agrobacterium vitis]
MEPESAARKLVMTNESLMDHLRGAVDGQARREYFDNLVAAMQAAISERLLQPGDLLPSERDFSAELGVSRNVIRRVISTLEAEGILSTRHGHGTFVPRELRKSTNSILGFSEEMVRRGMTVGNVILRFSRRTPVGSESIDMGMNPADSLIELTRIRLANDVPIAHEICLVPASSVSEVFDGTTSLYGEMDRQGTRPVRVLQEISAASANGEVAESLSIDIGVPVLKITRKGFDRNNDIVEYTASAFRSDRYTWITELHK